MADNWFQLAIKWLFVIIGVPTLTYILFIASIKQVFETATTFYQIFIGFVLIICLLFYVCLIINKLIEETKEFFN